MKSIIYLFILFSILHVLNAYTMKYSGHKVLRCTFDKILVPKIKKYAETHNIDIWDLSPGKLDVHITPEQEKELSKYKSFFQCIDFIPDLQSAIEHSDHRSKARSDNFFESYHSYEEIVQWMSDLVEKYPALLTMVEIGKTHQNRTMYALELNGVNQESEKTIYFQSNQHSREWISHMTVSYIIYSLVEAYGKNPTVTRIVDELNWRFVVMVNPDGYTYSRTNDRMWRKNRRNPPAGSSCYGVDTNRNWPAYWNRGGSSSNPCSDTYMGSSAASEIEVQNVIAYWKSLTNVVVSTDYHSYGQEVMTPWGWTTSKPQEPDYTLQTTLARKYVASVKQIEGKTYTVGTAGSFGIGSGGFDDYGYYEGTLYSQTVELRDTGRYGFLLPASEIIPTGNENFNGVITQAIHVLDG